MEKINNTQIIEPSQLYLDLSENLLCKIDLYLCNTNLTKKQQNQLIKIMEEVYGEGYTNCLIE